MKKLNYAIIGCGAAGKCHAFHFAGNPIISCVAAADKNYENARYFQSLFGFEKIYSDCFEMINNEQIDIVSITSPPYLHLQQIGAACKSKLNILCEKPLVISQTEIDQLVNLMCKHSECFSVMLPRRYYNNTLAVKKVIDSEALGDIVSISYTLECKKEKEYYSTWRGKKEFAGGGVLMSQAIHGIDQLIYLFGKPLAVKGMVWSTRSYLEVEDEADAAIFFKNNRICRLKATVNSLDEEWKGITLITGSEGEISLDSEKIIKWDVPKYDPPPDEEIEEVPEIYKPRYYGPGHLKVINDFIMRLLSKDEKCITGLDSLTAVKLILAIYECSVSGGKCELLC